MEKQTHKPTLKVAVIGSGPSGFYAAEALLRAPITETVDVSVDVYDRLPSPYGLVRFGVAPDHPKLKSVIQVFQNIAGMDGFRFFGNVKIGSDIAFDDLRACYHAVILATGAEQERNLNIDGEDLKGSLSAREFVGWYNGHPDYRDIDVDLSGDTAVIIGQGNVALDVARILAKSAEELGSTDIAQHALGALSQSNIRSINVIGRRGPAQSKCTSKELREFTSLEACSVHTLAEELVLDADDTLALEQKTARDNRANVKFFDGWAGTSEASVSGKDMPDTRCHFRFHLTPDAIKGEGRVEAIDFKRTASNGRCLDDVSFDCGLVIRCIGYQAAKFPWLDCDWDGGKIANDGGRVLRGGQPALGLYSVGWLKRGASGTIGSNRADSVSTVEALIEDVDGLLGQKTGASDALIKTLKNGGHVVVGFQDWLKIDAAEVSRGAAVGKPREKIIRREAMLEMIK